MNSETWFILTGALVAGIGFPAAAFWAILGIVKKDLAALRKGNEILTQGVVGLTAEVRMFREVLSRMAVISKEA